MINQYTNMKVPTYIVKDIESIFKRHTNNELEFRFGYFKNNRYVPEISYHDFNVLKNTLGKYKYIEKEVVIYKDGYRKVNGNIEYKERVKNISIHHIGNYSVRFSESIEKNVCNINLSDPIMTRNKKIYVFEFDNYDIELSNVNEKFECEIEFKKFNISTQKIFQPLKRIETILQEYHLLMKTINNTFQKNYKTLYYPINKPKNLKRHHLKGLKDYYVFFDKLDGVRFFLLECNYGTYLVNRTTYIKLDDKNHNSISIYDVEYTNEPYIFDVLIHKGKDVRKLNFFERFEIVMKTKYKRLHYSTDYSVVSYSEGCDGIIFTPIDCEYFNTRTYKYKPVEELTIDFQVDGDKLCVYSEGLQIYREGVKGFEEYDKQIVECKWDGEKFVPYRIRHDKISPNHKKVADDVVDDLSNPINLKTIMEYNK